jgi:CheY-like chemotaxis protein
MTKVLLVDDDRTTTALLKTLLELDGYDVTVVGRGVDVIPTAEKVQPDIVLTDYHLADMEGVEIVSNLRQHPTLSGVPIVVASGMDKSREVLAVGANEFIGKPFEPDHLPALFNKLLGH